MEPAKGTPLFIKRAIKLWDFPLNDIEGQFYDPLKNRIVVVMHPHVYAFEEKSIENDSNPVYFILPSNVEKTIYSLCISKEDCYIALQNKPYEVTLIDYTRYQVPFICKIATNKSNLIIGTSFLIAEKFDFITIEMESIHLYKFIHKDKKTSLSTVKTIVTPTGNYLLDPIKCVLVLSHFESKGLMQPYFFKNDEGSLRDVKGLEFNLKYTTESSKLFQEKREIYTRNIKNFSREATTNLQVIKLYDIYGRPSVIHYNPITGVIKIFFISMYQVRLGDISISVSINSNFIIQLT